jgi:hypothetical protein
MLYRAWPVAALGGVWILAGFFGWSLEPSAAPHDDHHDDAGHGESSHNSFGELVAGTTH